MSMLAVDSRVSEVSRRLRARADVILGVVWYTPEAREGFAGVDLPAAVASLASRAACLGRVSGRVVAAVFAAMEPTVVTTSIDRAWAVTDPATLLARRLHAATNELANRLGTRPDGIERTLELLVPAVEAARGDAHPMYAGLCSLPWPDTPLGDLWRACDMVREHRGDSHVHAWASRGIHPVEINLLSELWRGVPIGSVTTLQMGWSRDDVAAGLERLQSAQLVDGDHLTRRGKALREEVELATDAQEAEIVEALGDAADELLGLLDPWARAIATTMTPVWDRDRS